MEILNPDETYSAETLTIIERIGEDRLNVLQLAIDSRSNVETTPSAPQLIDSLVSHHFRHDGDDLSKIGYSTIADAIAEIGTSRGATRTFLRQKMSLQRAVNAHHAKARHLAIAQDREDLRQQGTAGTVEIYEDPNGLVLVELSTIPHYQFEGISLQHCLGSLASASAYLARGAKLFSLREDGIEPRATLEVDAKKAAVIQARRKHDKPLNDASDEYGALTRGLVPLARHVGVVSLVIADKVLHGNR